jgi:serine/threonine protein phosphatase PrpC
VRVPQATGPRESALARLSQGALSHSATGQSESGRAWELAMSFRKNASYADLPLVQLAEFEQGSTRLRSPLGAQYSFSLPTASPELARAYLLASARRPGHLQVDLTVVLEGTTVVAHGPPTCWEPGVAQRVQHGELRLGIIRVARPGSSSRVACGGTSTASPSATTSPSRIATPSRSATGPLAKIIARGVKVGTSSDHGGCAHMEDAHIVHAPAGGDFAFFGVFDGHGGHHAAHFCRDNLHFNVMASSSFRSGDPRAALRDGFRKTERDLIKEQRERAMLSRDGDGGGYEANAGGGAGCCGSTVLLMLLQAENAHMAWLGDCRAVLCRGGAAIALTEDHSLQDDGERARALADGGLVEGNRLGGFLEVARALGDFDHTQGRKPAGLSASPELRTHAVQPEDEFVVLGSDGLWGVVRPDDAVRLARAELQAYDCDATIASEKLVEVAIKRHCDDNVTAMVVCLNFSPSKVEEKDAPRRPRLLLAKRSTPLAAAGTGGSTTQKAPSAGASGGGGGGGTATGAASLGGGVHQVQSDAERTSTERTSNCSSSSSGAM